MILNQNKIEELIKCPKMIIKKNVPWRLERGHYRIDFELQSINKQYFFTAFGRYNEMFNENFSFGLVFIPKDEKRTYELLRCNGPHGEHKQYPHHIHYHIHKATAESIMKGLKEDCAIEITRAYATYEEAYRFFMRYINIRPEDFNNLFPPQLPSLFD